MAEQTILSDKDLAERWHFFESEAAYKKRFQRLRLLSEKNPRFLKFFKVGNRTRYRLEVIEEYEGRNFPNAQESNSNPKITGHQIARLMSTFLAGRDTDAAKRIIDFNDRVESVMSRLSKKKIMLAGF